MSMTNFARIAKVVALLLFLLPWVTVSCADQTLVSMSGLQMATGNIQMAANPMGLPSGGGAPGSNQGADMLIILGAALIVAGLVLGFVLKGRTGALAGAACAALAAIVLAYEVLVGVGQKVHGDASAGGAGGMPSGAGGPSAEQLAQMIKVNVEIGFYLCLASLVAAVILNVLAMRAAPVATAPPPAV